MDPSKIFRLNWHDVLRSALNAAFAAAFISVVGLGGSCMVDPTKFIQNCVAAFQGYDWLLTVNVALAAFFGNLGLRFSTDEDGKVMGRIQT